jgi:hypothetical protein
MARAILCPKHARQNAPKRGNAFHRTNVHRGRQAGNVSYLLPLLALLFLCAPHLVRAQYGSAVKLADLLDNRVTESSGLATSRLYPDPLTGVLWTHNDSGNLPYLFATNRQGEAIACFAVTEATNVDWEDLAEGPGAKGKPALYIADIGDNNRVRNDLALYRIPEPNAYRGAALPAITPVKVVERFPFRYPGGAHYDAETLLIHPATGEAYIVTKDSGGNSRVFQFPKPLPQQPPNTEITLIQVATLTFSHLLSYGRLVTGGDISPGGTKIALRTYTTAYEWPIHPGQTVAQALTSNGRSSFLVPFAQGESLAYRPDGLALLLTYEASPCPLYELPPL